MQNGNLYPQEILSRFPSVSRHVLLRWAKQGWVKTERQAGGQGGYDTHLYPEGELPRIAALAWGHDLKLPPDLSLRFASLVDPTFWPRETPDPLLERFRQLFQAIQDIPSMMMMLMDDDGDALGQVVNMAGRLIPSECCSLFLADGQSSRTNSP